MERRPLLVRLSLAARAPAGRYRGLDNFLNYAETTPPTIRPTSTPSMSTIRA